MDMLLVPPQTTSYRYGVTLIHAPITLARQCSNKVCHNGVEETHDNGDLFGSIDDLLDFSGIDDALGEVCNGIENAATAEAKSFSSSSLQPSLPSALSSPCQRNSNKQSILLGTQLPDALQSSELSIACEDIAELEWLSNFVEESFSSNEGSNYWVGQNPQLDDPEQGACKAVRKTEDTGDAHQQESNATAEFWHPGECQNTVECSSSVTSPALMGISKETRKSSTKRSISIISNAPVCFWNTQILSTEASECLIETSITNVSLPLKQNKNQHILCDDDDEEDDDVDPYDLILEKLQQSAKKKKRKQTALQPPKLDLNSSYGRTHGVLPINKQIKHKHISKNEDGYPREQQRSIYGQETLRSGNYSDDGGASDVISAAISDGARRCVHCLSDKTPQWRAGPQGPKTLCNACGVRYKSGRLFPEYRPAASPTFVENLHSNSHRRVIEMRKQRGVELASSTGHGAPYASSPLTSPSSE